MLPDLSARAHMEELMDGDCSFQDFRAALLDIQNINRMLFGYRPTLAWLAGVARGRGPLHVVDIGCGGGDMLRTIERWATRNGLVMKFTGIDLNPYATRVAQELTPSTSRITWLTGDAFSTPVEDVDVVISSLFAHHLTDDELTRFLRWMEACTRVGWFINDLNRSRMAYRGYLILRRVAGWRSFVKEDGLTSIRRSFRPNDWHRYLDLAEIPREHVHIEQWMPGRLCLGRLRA